MYYGPLYCFSRYMEANQLCVPQLPNQIGEFSDVQDKAIRVIQRTMRTYHRNNILRNAVRVIEAAWFEKRKEWMATPINVGPEPTWVKTKEGCPHGKWMLFSRPFEHFTDDVEYYEGESMAYESYMKDQYYSIVPEYLVFYTGDDGETYGNDEYFYNFEKHFRALRGDHRYGDRAILSDLKHEFRMRTLRPEIQESVFCPDNVGKWLEAGEEVLDMMTGTDAPRKKHWGSWSTAARLRAQISANGGNAAGGAHAAAGGGHAAAGGGAGN